MGYLLDPPGHRARNVTEQIDELREFCDRLTNSLNEVLNNLDYGNMS